ncbi:uncharacterized protein LOC124665500 [Lolium rigidum]|uniref:uncharacterized protein LOC124665500 n=1 Tax=Lolium rigidum TaxID=89674 RepID=UPI001F5DF3BB|nr:uncharacterized protein LOC124665500 [Lolium rigidum]
MGRKQEEATRPTFQRSESLGVEVSVANGFQRWKNLERRLGVDPRGGGAKREHELMSLRGNGMELQVFIGGGLGEDDVHVLDQPPSLSASVVPSPSSSHRQCFSSLHRQELSAMWMYGIRFFLTGCSSRTSDV